MDLDGNVVSSTKRTADRSRGVALSDRTRELISKLFLEADGIVISDLLYRAVSQNVPFCDNSSPVELERIRFAILKMTKDSPLNLAVGIHLAQTDWRDLLMSAGFGEDAERHMAWYSEQIRSSD